MNQVLMRSLNTSIAAVLPVLSLLVVGSGIMGAVALREFALALLVGLITGSYSSIFIAAPLLAILKEREPRYRSTCAVSTSPASSSSGWSSAVRRRPPARGRPGTPRRGVEPGDDQPPSHAPARPADGAHPPAAAAQEEAPLTHPAVPW